MGVRDSKPSFISYDDAAKRVSDSELRRIREAFKRCAGANGSALSLEAFVHEVLCDGVPHEVSEWLYQACGGTKRGITFKDLLCGVVVLTKGNIEEKIKFLWTLYVNNQNDNSTYIYKRDFARALHLENTSLHITEAHRTIEILTSLFGSGEKVTFDQFRSWLLIHKGATVLSKWLLCDKGNVAQDLETPTFYQSLAGVTHLEERDIIELEKCFWSLRNAAPTGELDATSMRGLLSPPLPRAAFEGTFLAFDENRDGHIDFKELCCGLSAACRGPTTERLKFCFKIFDLDRDGILNKKELIDMVGILCTVANEALKNQGSRSSTPSDGESEGEKCFDPEVILLNLRDKLITVPNEGRKPVFRLGSTNEDIVILSEQIPEAPKEDEGIIGSEMALRLEEFLIWSVEVAEALVSPFLELLFDVCHVVLGLRPQCRHRERDIVLGWVRRETCRGLAVGQFWYLVSAEWWSAWLLYASAPPHSCCRATRPHLDDAVVCDDSFTTNSTESMGSLLWRAESTSLGSAGGSSGVSSGIGRGPPHPGAVDNARLLAPGAAPARTLTGEGGHLRRDITLAQHRDFELVPDALWRALALWYGAPDPLPRQVIRPPNSDVELELYPLQLKILRHVPSPQRTTSLSAIGAMGGAGVGSVGGALCAPSPPERQLAYTAAFSRLATVKQVTEFLCGALGLAREDVRLWALGNTAGSGCGSAALLLDDERPTLQALRLDERTRLLLEVRNPDLTWPEEIGALGASTGAGSGRWAERRETLTVSQMAGATGLHNLGNTCYMNAALQSVWNTGPLTQYFNSGMHMYEVNTSNPLGTKGVLAVRYGELCKEVWSCSARSVAPLRVRWCVSRHARALAGGGQHDAQELLAWLLDALHEDLNRAAPPPRAPLPSAADSDSRPDQVVAAEAWAAYAARNDSIMTELFYGQLKSKVRCCSCGGESVRFDTFNMLSLPLPMESYVRATVRVILLDGSVPVKYGVRINSEGTYLDLKRNLSELCGLSPELMLLVLLSGATIGRVLEDGAKVSANTAQELFAYELPAPDTDSSDGEDSLPTLDYTNELEETDSGVTEGSADGTASSSAEYSAEGEARAAGEVSVARAASSSLCMPALFCFKRSRSEILMSQSPPSTMYGERHTLPRGTRVNHSPTPSVRSLNVRNAPRFSSVKFASSPAHMYRMNHFSDSTYDNAHYLVAVHRKQVAGEAYLVPWQRARLALFGVPLVVRAAPGASGRELYARVWTHVARLLSARPATRANHAADCDDSLGYEFPFTLRVVGGDGLWCALCAWPALCRGCALPTDDAPLVACNGTVRARRRSAGARPDLPDTNSPIAKAKLFRQTSARLTDAENESRVGGGEIRRLDINALRNVRGRVMLAIDWDPTALHLRYQSTREKAWIEHGSVGECEAAASRPIDLASCLRAFTSEESLEQRYHCAACRSAQPATKKLQIWRLPPIIIIHLKRFQYVNNKWIKSHKVVNFPFQDFDPTPFLASVPQETILRHTELKNMSKRRSSMFVDVDDHISESDTENSDDDALKSNDATSADSSKRKNKYEKKKRESVEVKGRQRLESTSLTATPVLDDNLVDYHQHHLKPEQDTFDLKYRLYAVVSHSGQLSGGHYVAYARNPTGAWLCYNDSSCRELPARPQPPLDPAAAYLLFYERKGLRYDAYLPDTRGRAPPAPPDLLDPDDADLGKMCVIS
ncbi:ubiquitin carboxyl-terminal hydrolase 32 isoform X3 [Bicyclus anynana]|uniref:ubiquitinyl hydrolase 1 n=1 Tax=Bicyclus anynana TaxID=110368 RepID=A0ABM3LJE0_BICAN|nr:ubiquitin carboxyl-terminal hydrolase 32 isoform X3 [Bicyclus anynana]